MSITTKDIENVRRLNHLPQAQIALELGLPVNRVEWIRRRYIGRVHISRPSVSKKGPALKCVTKRYTESDSAAAHWAGVTFENYRVAPERRTCQVMAPTWVPTGVA